MTTDLTATRKDEVRQLALDAINGMQSRFFRATVQLETEEEAKYAAGLWPGHRPGSRHRRVHLVLRRPQTRPVATCTGAEPVEIMAFYGGGFSGHGKACRNAWRLPKTEFRQTKKKTVSQLGHHKRNRRTSLRLHLVIKLMANEPVLAFPIYVIAGRDASRWRDGKRSGFKDRPWLIASFATEAEAAACKVGIQMAIHGMLRNVAFLEREEARQVDAEAVAKLPPEVLQHVTIKPFV